MLTRSLEHTFGECGETELCGFNSRSNSDFIELSPQQESNIATVQELTVKAFHIIISDIVMTQTHSLKKMEIIN